MHSISYSIYLSDKELICLFLLSNCKQNISLLDFHSTNIYVPPFGLSSAVNDLEVNEKNRQKKWKGIKFVYCIRV